MNQIKVREDVRHWATVALDRMLRITGASPPLAVGA